MDTDNAGRFEFGVNGAKYTNIRYPYEDSAIVDTAGQVVCRSSI